MEKKQGGDWGQYVPDRGQGNDEGDLSKGEQFHEDPEMEGLEGRSQQDQGGLDDLEEYPQQMGCAQERSGRGGFQKTFLDEDESPGFRAETERHEKENIPEGFFEGIRQRLTFIADFDQVCKRVRKWTPDFDIIAV